MSKILSLQGNMRDNVSVMDDSDYFWHFDLHKHCEILISKPRTAKGVQLANGLILELNL